MRANFPVTNLRQIWDNAFSHVDLWVSKALKFTPFQRVEARPTAHRLPRARHLLAPVFRRHDRSECISLTPFHRAVRPVPGNAMAEVSVLRLFLIYDELHHITWLTSEIPA